MTPTEQDNELRKQVEAIFKNPHCESCHEDWDYDSSYRTDSCCTRFMTDSISKVVELITADRERVALEARLNGKWEILSKIPDSTSVLENGKICSAYNLRIKVNRELAELKAQQEEV